MRASININALTTNAIQLLYDVEKLMLDHSEMEPFLRSIHKQFYKDTKMAEAGRNARELWEATKSDLYGRVVNQHQQVIMELRTEAQYLSETIADQSYLFKIRTDAFKRIKDEITALLDLVEENAEEPLAIDNKVRCLEFVYDALLDDLSSSEGELHRAQIKLFDLMDKYNLVVEEKKVDKIAEEFLNLDSLVDNSSRTEVGTSILEASPRELPGGQGIRSKDLSNDSGVEMADSPAPV